MPQEESTPTQTPSAQMEEDLQYTVLYIEDNPTNLLLVREILSTRPNITFLSADDAELGIELAQARCPDLILMDINLPGMDGIAATKQLQIYKETREIPVIAVSAYATEADKKKAMAAGFKDYITKPFNISEFLETIDEILKQNLQTD
ncbi:MAG: response regulator [Deltaproteobacteria bacterium]|nr:response regulator [Deltaproteobacteria bacterium]